MPRKCLVLHSFAEELVEVSAEELNIFVPMRANEHLRKQLLDKSEAFQTAVIASRQYSRSIEYLQRLCGKNSQQSMNIATELVRDMEQGTYYPPANKGNLSSNEVVSLTHQLIDAITLKKQEAAAAGDKK